MQSPSGTELKRIPLLAGKLSLAKKLTINYKHHYKQVIIFYFIENVGQHSQIIQQHRMPASLTFLFPTSKKYIW